VDFATDSIDAESFALVEPRGDEFVLCVAPGMSAERVAGGVREPVTAPETAISSGARYRVSTGEQSFLVSSVPAPKKHPVPLFATWERSVLAFAGASLAVHLGMVALLDTMAPDGRALNDDDVASEGRLSRIALQPAEDKPTEALPAGSEGTDGSDGIDAARAPGEEGKIGEKRPIPTSGRYQMKKRGETPQIARAEAIAQARHAGILGELRPQVFASLTGTGDFSSGFDSTDVLEHHSRCRSITAAVHTPIKGESW